MCIRDRNRVRAGGTAGGVSSVGETEGTGGAISSGTAAIGGASDNIFASNAVGAATSGIGVLRRTGSAVLKLQLDALETEGLSKTISNPKLFSLDNQTASIKQGVQIQLPGSGDTGPQLVDAALILKITPSIIGDGNVLMDIKVNDDSPDTSFGTDEPAIKTNEIKTKLLVSDGDIVVIGGIKKNTKSDTKTKTPGLADQKNKALGNLFKSRNNTDTLTELLIFIAHPNLLKYLDVNLDESLKWDELRDKIKANGMRNSNTLAIAPTATISNICGVSQSIEPTYQNLYVKSNLSGEFTVINPYLINDLKSRDLWDEVMIKDLKYFDGQLQPINRVPDDLKAIYSTCFEIDTRWLVEAAARRQKWIDQSQSLNLYIPDSDGKKLDSAYKLAWIRGLKTTYYLRSLGATHVEKSTSDTSGSNLNAVKSNDDEAKQCLIDDPDCEACQ